MTTHNHGLLLKLSHQEYVSYAEETIETNLGRYNQVV